MMIFEIERNQNRFHSRFCQKILIWKIWTSNFEVHTEMSLFGLLRVSTNYITSVLKALNKKSKSMQKSDSIQPRSCLIQKKHVAELVRRRSKNLKFSEKIVGLVKITLNYIYKSHMLRVAVILVHMIWSIGYGPYDMVHIIWTNRCLDHVI